MIPVFLKNSAKTNDNIAISFIKMFNEGPLVSFIGSPTVSPTTAAFFIIKLYVPLFLSFFLIHNIFYNYPKHLLNLNLI